MTVIHKNINNLYYQKSLSFFYFHLYIMHTIYMYIYIYIQTHLYCCFHMYIYTRIHTQQIRSIFKFFKLI